MRKMILRVNIEILDEDGKCINKCDLKECAFSKPTMASEVGLPMEEQLSIISDIQQNVLDNQAAFLK